ncbi:MAG: hypothetical protein ACERKZ_05510 [Lachnotalea sp.]
MSYLMVNEELNIMSCGIEDLTEKRKNDLIKQFQGSRIETLTMFYNDGDDILILNRDNIRFEFYKKLAVKYLGADEEGRIIINNKFIGKADEELELLYDVMLYRKHIQTTKEAKKIQKILGKQNIAIYDHNYEMIFSLLKINCNENGFFAFFDVFMYGYIQGIRSERARRKGLFKIKQK